MTVAQVIPQYRQTEGQGERRLLTPDEVLRLPNEELWVIIRGRNILKLNKLDYTKLPMAAEIHQASIMDYCPVSDIYHTAADFPTKQPARMEPAVPADSWILGLRIHGAPQRGDIVIFVRENQHLVKRIAAVPGDTVNLNDYTHSVSINVELPAETRILLVPENSYFSWATMLQFLWTVVFGMNHCCIHPILSLLSGKPASLLCSTCKFVYLSC